MKFKRGDTFKFTVVLTELVDDVEQPLITDVENIKCQVRTAAGKLIEDLLITAGATNGEYEFSSVDTSQYPTETLEMDIQVNKDGDIGSTQTFKVEVEKDITRSEE